MKKVSICALAALFTLLAVSCAKTATEDEYFAYNRVLQAWINVNYPGVAPNDSGIFILEATPGTGRPVTDSGYVFAHYYSVDLKGDFQATNIDTLYERLYGRGVTYYSGSAIWQVDQGYIPGALNMLFKQMKEGGEVLMAVPVKMGKITTSAYTEFSESASDNLLYYVKIDRVVDDIKAYQDSILTEYSKKYFGGMDSLSDGFYFKLIGRRASSTEEDTLADETVHPLRYWGKRVVDGVMFDTNVKDTAKKFDLYSSSSSYDTLGVTRYSNITTMISSNAVIEGFSRAVHEMHLGDTVEVFFRSDLGYGIAGSGSSIPGYAPLFFRLYTDPDLGKDDDDDDE